MIASRAIAFQATPCGCRAWVLAIDHDRVDLVGVADRPLERLHPAERPAGDGGQPLDAEHVEEGALGAHHVGDGDDREVRAVRPCRSPGRSTTGPVVPRQPPSRLVDTTK